MDQKQIVRQMLEFNRTAFDNSFKVLVFFQNQIEQHFLRFLEKANWMPEEGKKIINEWTNAYKKNYENFKTYTDENYKKVADYFAKVSEEEQKTKKK